MTVHHYITVSSDVLRSTCACGWSVASSDRDETFELWHTHMATVHRERRRNETGK